MSKSSLEITSEDCRATQLGVYGTFLFPEQSPVGFWRLQTDFPPLVEHMKERHWNPDSPWQMVGRGTSFIFRRKFAGTHEAFRSFERILRRLEVEGLEEGKIVLRDSRILWEPSP